MIDCEYVLRQTNSVYAAYADQKENIESFNENAYMQSAVYADVRFALRACIFDLQKAMAFGDEKLAAELERKRAELSEELETLKKSLDADVREYVPHCAVCKDTGIVDGKRCKCYYRTMNDVAYSYFSLRTPLLHKFSDNTLTDETTLKLIEKLKKYCEGFGDESKSLMFLGKRGTGKTFLAEAIAHQLNESGKNALVLNAFQLNDIFLKLMRAADRDYMITKQILTTVDYLVIDDLGAAPVLKKVTAENILMIISERQTLGKPFMITTNLGLDEIDLKFGERVFSRMCGKSTVKIPFNGEDLRISD